MLAGSGTASLAREEELARRVALISVSVGILLSLFKILIGLKAGSTSVVSDGLEAGIDALSSGIVYSGLRLASKPPDSEHPYGHGRYETLSGLAVGAILLLTGTAILWHGITTVTAERRLAAYALYPLIAAIFVKSTLAIFKFRAAKRAQSTSLETDAWHDITDMVSTGVAFAAVLLTLANPQQFGKADPIGGIIIGLIVLFLSVKVVRRTVDQLVDTMPEQGKLEQIRNAAMKVKGALGIEKCFARRTGLQYHVDLHLEVDPDMSVRQSHDIATQVRFAIIGQLPWVADVLVHVEPSPTRMTIGTSTATARNFDGE